MTKNRIIIIGNDKLAAMGICRDFPDVAKFFQIKQNEWKYIFKR